MKKIISLLGICIILMGISSAALKERGKEITVYTAQEGADVLLEDFKKKYPDIKLNVVKGSTGDITAKILLEKGNPQADIIWNLASSGILEADRAGILEGYKAEGLENIDKKYYDSKNEEPTWVGTTLMTGVIVVNEEEAKKKNIPIPQDYNDLTNPIYKNELVMPNPVSSGTGYLMLNSWLQNEKGWEYMDLLNKNMKLYTSSGSAPAKSTAIGEQVIGLSFDKNSLNLEKDVKQIKTIFPNDLVPWDIDAMGLVKKKEIKEEAKIFYEWAISEEVMNLYLETRTMTTLKDGNISEDLPKGYKERLSENNFYKASEEKREICDEWTKRYSERD